MVFSKLGDGVRSTSGSALAEAARPDGYMLVVARRTANHSALLDTSVRVGSDSARPTHQIQTTLLLCPMFESLRGHFLIAGCELRDPNFFKTVVLGASGILLGGTDEQKQALALLPSDEQARMLAKSAFPSGAYS